MSPADRWDEVERHFDAILEEMEELREDVPSWAKHAHFEQMARVERTASKVRTFRKVAGAE